MSWDGCHSHLRGRGHGFGTHTRICQTTAAWPGNQRFREWEFGSHDSAAVNVAAMVELPDMEMSQLRSILALKDLASFARAGEQLHLSPPAVFGQIRQLEDELGEKLYERIGKRLQR